MREFILRSFWPTSVLVMSASQARAVQVCGAYIIASHGLTLTWLVVSSFYLPFINDFLLFCIIPWEISVLLLNASFFFEKFRLMRSLAFLFFMTFGSFNMFALGYDSLWHYWYLVFACFYPLALDDRDRWKMYIQPVIILPLLVMTNFEIQPILDMPADFVGAIGTMNTLLVSGSAMLLGVVFGMSVITGEKRMEQEQEKSESLLLNVLPKPIADRLKSSPGTIADGFDRVTVLFADIVDFTKMSQRLGPDELVNLLDKVFTEFDRLADRYGLEKIKTIGDAYMIVGGVPTADNTQHNTVLDMALNMQEIMRDKFSQVQKGPDEVGPLELRVGIHTGPAVAGIIGKKKFSYDLWGDSVNTAARMESHGVAGRIQVTQAVYDGLHAFYHFTRRGEIDVKGKGIMEAWFLRREEVILASRKVFLFFLNITAHPKPN